MLNIILFLFLPFLYSYIWQKFFPDLLLRESVSDICFPQIGLIAKYPPEKISKKKSNKVSLVYMTCYDSYSLDPKKFNLQTYHISCKHRESDECHEAVPYLRFIYDHYDDLEGKIFFVHGHVYSWHYPENIYRLVEQRMKSKQFKNDSFGSLTYWQVQTHIPWQQEQVFADLFDDIYHDTTMMKFKNIKSYQFYCCASFFVDADNFKIRPRYVSPSERINVASKFLI